jgi:predicted DNA binding CopG/RHH family protein
MPKTDPYESEILEAYGKGELSSVATAEDLATLTAAARSTSLRERRVNIRLTSGDLQEIQVKALEEGVPYQALISSILHKYVTGRLVERSAGNASRAGGESRSGEA